MVLATVVWTWCLLWWGIVLVLWSTTGVWRWFSPLTLFVAWFTAPIWVPRRWIQKQHGAVICLLVTTLSLWAGGQAALAR